MWGNATTVARIGGFDIRIDASWFIIATLIVWTMANAVFPADLPDAGTPVLVGMGVVAMLGLFGSLVLHELAHATVARHNGIGTRSITLFLFGGVAELESEPSSGAVEFRIALAGPAASLGIAGAFWISARLAALAGVPDPARIVLAHLGGLNLVLALFNLLPAFPMDGGRVLRALLWARSGNLLSATRRATAVSTVFAYGLMGLGLVTAFSGSLASGLWPMLIGLFLLVTSRTALAQAETGAALDGRRVADLMTRAPITARPDLSLADLVERVFLDHAVSFVPVLENGVLLGYVDHHMVRRIDREHRATTTVEDLIETAGPDNTVTPDMPCLDLVERIARTGRRKFLVADAGGLAGVITLSDLLAFVRVAQEVR